MKRREFLRSVLYVTGLAAWANMDPTGLLAGIKRKIRHGMIAPKERALSKRVNFDLNTKTLTISGGSAADPITVADIIDQVPPSMRWGEAIYVPEGVTLNMGDGQISSFVKGCEMLREFTNYKVMNSKIV